jgi:hypothetical protein
VTDAPVCAVCRNQIRPDEPIVFEAGRTVHLRCLPDVPAPRGVGARRRGARRPGGVPGPSGWPDLLIPRPDFP